MSEMVERVGKAMWEAVIVDGAATWDWDDPTCSRIRETYMKAARVAIGAMREPTEEMMKASWVKLANETSLRYAIWVSMLTAALAEDHPHG